jgi:hypothetical protein
MNYIMPFLIIVCVGVIVVLGFNLWKSIFGEEANGDAFLHIESGSVQVKMWGSEEFLDFTSDALIMEGDEIRASANAKVIVEFFDGTIVRLSGGSGMILSEINSKDDSPEISILLVDGSLWFNKMYKETDSTGITVTMSNVVVNSSVGSIFEVENSLDEVVRVLHGENVEVDVLNKDTGKVIETESVGVGQEIVFTDKVLEKYLQYQSPSVLEALSDEFKQSEWYLWNDAEDKAPTQFDKSAILGGEENALVEVAPEVFEPETEAVADGEVVVPEEGTAEEEASGTETVAEVDLGVLTTPTITSVAGITEVNADGFYVVTSSLATLTGTVSGAEKVEVNGYTLQKFVAGDKTWTYFANADYGLMQEGENVYEVYGVGPNGEKSGSLSVKVLYLPPAPAVTPVEEVVPADGEVAVEAESGDAASVSD